MKKNPTDLSLSEILSISEYCPPSEYGYNLFWKKVYSYDNTDFWLEYFKKENINKFCNQYNKVFADTFNWPYCYTINDFYSLPEYIIEECKNVHRFSPEIWITDSGDPNFFDPTKESMLFFLEGHDAFVKNTGYSFSQLIKVKNHILDYIDIFKNKKVLEWGACDGLFSAVAIINGAESTTAVDILPYHVDLINFTRDYLNLKNEMYAADNDVNDLENTTKLSSKHDVVFMNNFLITVPNKYEVISATCKGNPEYIVIGEPFSYRNKGNQGSTNFETSANPVIEYLLHQNKDKYRLLYTNYPQHETYNNIIADKEFIIGVANQSWYDMIFKSHGYELERTKKYMLEDPDAMFITRVYRKISS
jgi:hypothetical protein